MITIATSRRNVAIPWTSLVTLLLVIRRIDSAKSIRAAFADVDATPVELSAEDKAHLVELLNFWSTKVSVAKLPEGIWDLRNALVDDLDYAEQRQDG